MRTRRSRFFVALFAAAVACSSAATAIASEPSLADRANARVLFNTALDLRATGDHDGALKKLRAADALLPTPRIKLELGREELYFGEVAEAYVTFLTASTMPVDPSEETKYLATRQEAAKLAATTLARAAKIRLRFNRPPHADVKVSIDMHAISVTNWESPLLVNAGLHTVRVESLGTVGEHVVTLQEAEEAELAFALPPALVVGAPIDSPPLPAATVRNRSAEVAVVGWVVGGVSMASGAGLLFSGKAKQALASSCTMQCSEDDGAGRRTAGTLSLIAGGAVFVGASLLWFFRADAVSKPSVSVSISPTGFSAFGRF